MPNTASEPGLRLALLSLFSLSDRNPATCRAKVDAAARLAATAPAAALGVAGPVERTAARLDALRVLNSLCGACRACERGRDPEAKPVMLPPREPARRTTAAEPPSP